MSTRFVLPTLFALALAGCQSEPAPDSPPAAPAASHPAAPTPEASPEAAPVPAVLPEVVARIDDQPITAADLEKAIHTLEERVRQKVPAEQRNRVYRDVLEQLVAYRLLSAESRKREIAVSPDEITERMKAFRQPFATEQEFQAAVKSQGLSVEAIEAEVRGDLAVAKLVQAETGTLSVTPVEVKAFYDQNPGRFQEGEAVRASHILIGVEAGQDAAAHAAARKKAEDIKAQLDAGGDFAALAKQHSTDPGSAPGGGDLGFFGRGQMVPAFEAAAFALQPGETSPVVESRFGYHIIRLQDRRAPKQRPFEDVREQIRQVLAQQKRGAVLQKLVERLKAERKVDVLI